MRMDGGNNYLAFKISRDLVLRWLSTIYELTGVPDLDSAITFAYHVATTEEQKRTVYTVSELIRREASGEIQPPLNIYRLYARIAQS